ncbi:DUF4870 domain-containing protein [Haloarchaeobius sp. HME9146]|uniref:DUF4870 domain-containing protein n=1 Tax=Haloarchaeobius sp. HME9146 TaxID=2978732 RepID=UPI0021BEB997|nr:hypothetical protein [Haloarchaeobius sp. HME9146]MCT9097087.1 hypothetical protein [Haloarchaeobius sp. HME9146]
MATDDITADPVATADSSVTTDSTTHTPSETSLGVDENVAGALAYVFGVISGAIVFVLESENEFVRFHAAQSIVLSIAIFVAAFALTLVNVVLTFAIGGLLGGLISLVLSLVGLVFGFAAFGIWVYMLVRTYQGRSIRLPVVSGIADSLV